MNAQFAAWAILYEQPDGRAEGRGDDDLEPEAVVFHPIERKVVRTVAGEGESKGGVDDVWRVAAVDDDQTGVGMVFAVAIEPPAPKGQQTTQVGIEGGSAAQR